MNQVFCALLGAIIHDFEHLGLNNDILVKMGHEWAIEYNDRAPNENHHLCAAFRVMRKKECDFMENLPREKQQLIRKLVLDMVLATDMVEHHRIVNLINTDLRVRLNNHFFYLHASRLHGV
jgi:hypothetical protein